MPLPLPFPSIVWLAQSISMFSEVMLRQVPFEKRSVFIVQDSVTSSPHVKMEVAPTHPAKSIVTFRVSVLFSCPRVSSAVALK